MPTFRCKYATPEGRFLDRTLSAESKSALKWELEKEGNFVLKIRRAEKVRLLPAARKITRRIRMRDFYGFNQEFLVLVKTGIPIVSALDAILEKAESTALVEILKQVRYDISTGEALSDAVARHPKVFSNLYVASLKAGERSGNIPMAISRHIEYLKKSQALRKKVISASTYPLILVAASVIVLMLLMTYVVPAFTRTYFETGTQLPALTMLLIGTANGLRENLLWVLGAVAVLAAALAYARTQEPFQLWMHRVKLKLPVLGKLMLSYATAQLTRTLSVVLGGGTTLIESVRISAGVMNNLYLEAHLREVTRRLEEGTAFSTAIIETETFPPLAARMIAAGESGGELEPVLAEIADFYDTEVENGLTIISTAVEPTLMVVMGLVIGLIVVAMYLPIFQLAGTVF
ncbi:MAG: type II secretion system F family protein [Desulfobacterales bacterium]